MREKGGVSWGGVNCYPQFAWHIDHQEDKRAFRSGCSIRLRAVDNSCGERGRIFCSNLSAGTSFTGAGEEETGNTYGWDIKSANGSRYISTNSPVFLMQIGTDKCMRSDMPEGGMYQFCEPDEDDEGTQWTLGKITEWQESSDGAPEGRRIESGETIQLAKMDMERSLCSNMSEGGGASYGGIDCHPQFSWRLISGTGKKYIKQGDQVILACLDESTGEKNRVFCNNNQNAGCSWSNPPISENAYTYGFTMSSFSGSRYLRFGDPIALTSVCHGQHLRNDTEEGGMFTYTDDLDEETNGWVIANFDNVGDDWGGYTSEESDW